MIPSKQLNNINMQTGAMTAAQAYTNQQIYTKGYQYTVAIGTGNNFNPNLGGKARFLWGICLFSEVANANDLDLFSLTINSEVICDKVLWNTYNPQQLSGNVNKNNQFFALPRLLSGADSVEINYNSINAHKINVVFYLSDVRP
jgi:hypothetical protein